MSNEQMVIALAVVIFSCVSIIGILGVASGVFANPFYVSIQDESDIETVLSCVSFTYEVQEVSGVVNVSVLVPDCKCAGVTKLYINGDFYSNGTLLAHRDYSNSSLFEVFVHQWDTREYVNGRYLLSLYGKHDELVQSCVVEVINE